MMKKWLGSALMAVCALGFSALAHAAPYKWTFTGVTFDDGSTASGSFVADMDTQAITQINISVTEGNVGGAVTFRQLCAQSPCNAIPVFVDRQPGSDMTGMNLLLLSLADQLPANGGSVGVIVNIGTCTNVSCSQTPDNLRTSTNGTLVGVPYAAPSTATPVPTLNDWGLLLLSALTIGAAGFFTRKRLPN